MYFEIYVIFNYFKMSEVMSATKVKYNRRKAEYIDKLPENVIQINSYDDCSDRHFILNRYWWDPINLRIIMKPKRGKRYKIVKPMNDRRFDESLGIKCVTLIDINDRNVWVCYKRLLNQINESM